MSTLKIDHLSKSIKKKQILQDVNLCVEEGEIVGFVGPNGAGKTTTIKLCLGLLKPDSGSIFCNDIDIQKDFPGYMKNICGIMDKPNLYGYLSAVENLLIQADIYNIGRSKISDVLDFAGLQNRSKDKVKTFSFGMKQRLNIARAFLVSPRVILLDEPFNGIDPEGIADIRKLLTHINKEYGTSILVSSHLLSEVEKICSRVCCIKTGKIMGEIDLEKKDTLLLTLLTSNIEGTRVIIKNNLQRNAEIRNDHYLQIMIKTTELSIILDEIERAGISVFNVKTDSPLEKLYLEMMGGNVIV
ncbi:MAG: ABC transporter ATP-binding protein [Saccharofermentanales bacterium]